MRSSIATPATATSQQPCRGETIGRSGLALRGFRGPIHMSEKSANLQLRADDTPFYVHVRCQRGGCSMVKTSAVGVEKVTRISR